MSLIDCENSGLRLICKTRRSARRAQEATSVATDLGRQSASQFVIAGSKRELDVRSQPARRQSIITDLGPILSDPHDPCSIRLSRLDTHDKSGSRCS